MEYTLRGKTKLNEDLTDCTMTSGNSQRRIELDIDKVYCVFRDHNRLR